MKLVGVISTAVLSLILGVAASAYAQEPRDQQQEEKAKPAQQEEKKTQPVAKQEQKAAPQQQEKNTKQEEKSAQQQQQKNTKQEEVKNAQQQKNTQQEEKTAQQQQQKNAKQEEVKNAQQQQQKNTKQEEKSAQQQHAGNSGGGRIPDDRFKAHFGREHSFRVSQGDYRNRRFRYGGYWFGFADPWPSNWLYTQDVYVIEINGVYYLCNPMYPGVNIALSFEL